MRVIREYKRAESLEEAWQLNQKKSNRVLGGMVWLKMGKMQIGTAIDLSSLGLDTIEETGEEFRIGCMVTLRDSIHTRTARRGSPCAISSGSSSGISRQWVEVFMEDTDFPMC